MYTISDSRRKWANKIVSFRYGMESGSVSDAVHFFCPDDTREFCLIVLGLLYLSKARPTMVCETLHLPLNQVQCKVSAPDKLRCGTNATLVLYHLFEGSRGFIKTDDEAWNNLMKHVRHKASHTNSVHLVIGRSFWDIALWRDGAQEVLHQTSLRNISSKMEYPNFLAKIAKIAAPAHRWKDFSLRELSYDASEDPHYSFEDTALQITIDGTESVEQLKFVRELEDEIHELRTARPLFHWRGEVYTRTEKERKRFKLRTRSRYLNDYYF